MLHALLHHKLDELIPEPQRREDALTSAVFGTLVLINAWDVLARWLGICSEVSVTAADSSNSDCWFWPRLAFAEPDVVLRLGSFLAVVEAKYRSGRNDLVPAEDEDADLCDQLFRQHRSIREPVEGRVRYAERIEHAIAECQLVQVFVIDARQRRARREWEESKGRLPPEADLRLVTWQDLFRLLNDPRFLQNRWAIDLRCYLQVCDLDTFEGVGRHLAAPKDVTRIRQWREPDDYGRWQNAVATLFTGKKIAGLKRWRLLTEDIATRRWVHGIDPGVIESARDAIVAWRVTSNEHADRRTAEPRRRNS